MAHHTFSSTFDNTSLAAYKTWGLSLKTALNVLFTQIAQTTDPDWVNIGNPPTAVPNANTANAIEIYQLTTGALHTSNPLYLKVEYGTGSSGSYGAVFMSIGKGNDGNGALVNTIFAKTMVLTAGTAVIVASNCYLSNCGGAGLALVMVPGNSPPGGFFIVERAMDSIGTPLGSALMVTFNRTPYTSSMKTHVISYDSGSNNIMSQGCTSIPFDLSANNSAAFGMTAPVFPGTVISPNGLIWSPRSLVGCANANVGLGQVVSSLLEGIDYMGLGAGANYSDAGKQPYSSIMIRWD